jgi:hypothetical protein
LQTVNNTNNTVQSLLNGGNASTTNTVQTIVNAGTSAAAIVNLNASSPANVPGKTHVLQFAETE